MKTITLLALIAAMGVVACSKSSNSSNANTSSNYYVKAIIDGVNVSYTNYTGALNQNYATMNVFGYNSNATNADGINILFQLLRDNNNTNIAVGIYTDTANYSPTDNPNELPDSANNNTIPYFNTNEANIFLQQSGSQYVSNGVMNAANSTPFTCTITSINNQSVSGTFSGTAYFGSAVKKVTNGNFHVAF
jgi:hypothetical protein